MNIVKMTSCSLVLGILVPYYFIKDENNDEKTNLIINRSKINLQVPLYYSKFKNTVNYSIAGIISGIFISNFI